VAKAIGEVLCQKGNTVETKWVKHVKDLHNYYALLLGSAIQYDRWAPEATTREKGKYFIGLINQMSL
jgi:menaquinone-dependent protoporphyrinogen IX oxidase